MKMIHNKTLDQFCQGNDKILCPADLNDGVDNGIVICLFVQDFRLLRDQLLDHIGIVCRESFTDFGTGIFGLGYFGSSRFRRSETNTCRQSAGCSYASTQ